jgi:hypothetical protein
MFCEHVGLFRLSSAEVQVQNTPHCLPSPSPQGRVAKKRKNQLRSTTVTTPRSLLMAAIKSISPYSWNHLSTSLTHPLPISFLFSYTVLSHHSLILEHYSRSHLLPSLSGLPVPATNPRDNLSLMRAISAASMYCSLLRLLSNLCSLWVYHRDFGATFSVIYGK